MLSLHVKEIPLRSHKYPGLVALVDDEDYERVSQHVWWPSKSVNTFYAVTRPKGRRSDYKPTIYLHKLILGVPEAIDHCDGNGLNCQRNNLRPATNKQNMHNRTKQNGIKHNPPYKGVTAEPNSRINPWKAAIVIDGKRKHIGGFPTPEAAAYAYDKAAREAFGEFARTNFQEEV